MALGLGLGFGLTGSSGGGVPLVFEALEMWDGQPSDVTYARADAVAYTIGSNGKAKWCSSGEYRLWHTLAGVPLGMACEYSRTNRFSGYSAAPDNTGFTTTGTAVMNPPTADLSALTAAGLDGIITNVYSASGGASGGTIIFPGTINSTSPSAFAITARVQTGTTATLKQSNAATGTTAFTNTSSYDRIKLQNQTVGTTDTIVLDIPASTTVYFTLPQMEVGVDCTTPILTAGAAATRQADVGYVANFNTKDYFRASQMTILFEGTPWADQYMGGAAVSNYQFYTGVDTTTEGLGISAGGAKNQFSPLGIAPGAAAINASSPTNFEVGPIANQETFSGISYRNGDEITAWADGFAHKNAAFGSMTGSNMSRLSIGHRYSGASVQFFNGIVRRVVIINRKLSMVEAAAYYESKTRNAVIDWGQSNKLRDFSEAGVTGLSGHQAAIVAMNTALPSTPNFVINCSYDGSRLAKSSPAQTDYWWDPATDTFGPPMDRWEARVNACLAMGMTIIGRRFDQGEGDTGRTDPEYTAAYDAIETRQQSIIGVIPEVIRRIGRRTDGGSGGTPNATYEAQVQTIRNAQTAFENTYAHIYMGPEKINADLSDIVHLTQAGYAETSGPLMRKLMSVAGYTVSGVVDGPRITGWSRVGDVITVDWYLDPNGATDFTGTKGLRFFDSGVEILGTFAKVSPTQATFTLASTPSGTEVLYYGYGSLYREHYATEIADLIRDNSTYALSMRMEYMPSGFSWTPPVTGDTYSSDDAGSNQYFVDDANSNAFQPTD